MKQLEQHVRLSAEQRAQLASLETEFLTLNARFNLVSEESAGAFWDRHVLHSLTLARQEFPAGCVVVDWGTGGGLPLLPLAIAFPAVRFVGVDSVGKKVRAVAIMAKRLGLSNVETWHGRAERWPGEAHYAVSRATAPLESLWKWTERILVPLHTPLTDSQWPQGLLTLKGGDLTAELAKLPVSGQVSEICPVVSLLDDAFFEEKVLIHVTPA